MKKIIIFLCLGLFIAFSAHASKLETAAELLKITNPDRVFVSTYEQAIQPVLCTVLISAEEQEKLKKEFMEIIDIPSFMNVLTQFWIDNFTEEELKQLVAFYQTQAGKKILQMMPQYTQFMMIETEKLMQNGQEKFFELGEKINTYPKRPAPEAEACLKEKIGM